jgi:catechol 2,3-dioxygenase-like lactoylglutathione lyase family enzyme
MSNKFKPLPAPHQAGIIVENLEESIKKYNQLSGQEVMMRLDFSPEKHWVFGKERPIQLDIAMYQIGDMQIELIEPIDSPLHEEYMKEHGEGFNHFGYYVDDYDGYYQQIVDQGYKLLMNAEYEMNGETLRAAYFDTSEGIGIWTELIEKGSWM